MRFLVLSCLVGCIEPIDQRWELDHDHVVAVRATPPSIVPGQWSRIDALIAHAGAPTTIESPVGAVAQVPAGDPLEGIVSQKRDGGWYLTAPSEETLAAVRTRDGLAADAPVPVPVAMAFGNGDDVLYAKKTIYLGAQRDNPAVPIMAVDGQPAADRIVVPMERDVYVSVPTEHRVNWLTSCGALFQDDVATAFLRVAGDDRCDGELAVVIRDAHGGVAWRVWPVLAQ